MLQCCAQRPGKQVRAAGTAALLGAKIGAESVNKEFKTVGLGHGGIEELSKSLNENAVTWGLIAQSVGSGTMARTKYVFLYFSGASVPMVKRMRYTELVRPSATGGHATRPEKTAVRVALAAAPSRRGGSGRRRDDRVGP